MTEEPLAYGLLRSAERSAAHMELRDAYTPDDPDWLDWQAGRRFDPEDRWASWSGLIRAAGEQVRWLPRRDAAGLLVPCSDFWVFDDQVLLWNHFAGDGSWVGEEKCDDPAVAKLCASSFDAAWDRAVPHEAYRPA